MMKIDFTLVAAVAGVAFGLVGTILGLLNTWQSFNRDRVRIQVIPVGLLYSNGMKSIGIEVTNHSVFPVTITEVSFALPGVKKYRFQFLPTVLEGCDLPQLMEARTSFTVRFPPWILNHPEWENVNKAFVRTACGKRFSGTSGALRQLVRSAARKQ